MKRCSDSFIIKEMQIKTINFFYKLSKIKKIMPVLVKIEMKALTLQYFWRFYQHFNFIIYNL